MKYRNRKKMKGTLFILQEYLTYASCLDATVGSRGVLTPYFMNIPSPLYYYKNKPPFLNLSPLPPHQFYQPHHFYRKNLNMLPNFILFFSRCEWGLFNDVIHHFFQSIWISQLDISLF